MTYLFISDLHLSPQYPQLTQGFIQLLQTYQNQQTQLYILGDWFNAWLGDDNQTAWLDHLVQHLKQFSQAGNKIYFLAGNRDFILGQKFLDQFQGILLPEISFLTIGSSMVRLEHGDGLCTDDVSYQRFKQVIRNPIILRLLKKTPLNFRKKLAHGFRQKSQQLNQIKSYSVMDVNQEAVEQALQGVDLLIHGHTHRPNIHHIAHKKRIVLGDWRKNEAQILEMSSENISQFNLYTWYYS